MRNLLSYRLIHRLKPHTIKRLQPKNQLLAEPAGGIGIFAMYRSGLSKQPKISSLGLCLRAWAITAKHKTQLDLVQLTVASGKNFLILRLIRQTGRLDLNTDRVLVPLSTR
jgi:hypothetical protein